MEACASRRLLEAIAGQELIYFLGVKNDFETFLALFDVIDLRNGGVSPMKDGAIYVNDLYAMVRTHAERRTSHVLITGLNENWGAFSTVVPNRTVDWGAWQDHLADAGCTLAMVREYLDDPAVHAVVTPHHSILWHPKILSIPVGVSGTFKRTLLESRLPIHELIATESEKIQDLLINNSGWGHREEVNRRVIANFDGCIRNTFGLPQSQFLRSVTHSRFVLCPSGLGWDTSRLWETLTLGSVPIVEYSEGWHTVLDELPVLFVTNFDEVTPALLAAAYPDILSRCELFNYDRLTTRWWVSRITRLLDAPLD